MPPAAVASGVILKASAQLQEDEELWAAMQTSFHGRVTWEAMDESSIGSLGSSLNSGLLKWAYLETDFQYAAHRALCQETTGCQDLAEDLGTQFPLALVYGKACSAANLAPLVAGIVKWLGAPGRSFTQMRLMLVLYGARPASLGPCAGSLAEALLRWGAGFVEVRSAEQAAVYTAQCAASVAVSKKRRVPSRFKVAGARCQTLPRDPEDRLRITWVSQLMQIPGVSEEIAKAVAGRHQTPGVLLEAVAEACRGGPSSTEEGSANSIADKFLSDLEIPIRGKKGTRRLGPIVSRRIFTLFHPNASSERVLT